MSTSFGQNELLTRVGNGWIICRSKSYGNRVYYFNTETGLSVWNLSETEIRKAKGRTHILEKQFTFTSHDCPEPSYSPYANLSYDWKRPQTSFVNQRPAHALQPRFNNKSLESLSNGFRNFTKTQFANQNQTRNFKSNFHPRQKKPFNSNFHSGRKNGQLRRPFNKLNLKKKYTFHKSDSTKYFRKTNYYNRNKNENISFDMLNEDDMWLAENLQSQGKKGTLDLTLIKKYLQIKSFKFWYIIVDSNALLNNINFINILTNSDKQCRLVVPKVVMDNIKKSSNSGRRTQCQRVEYFISQQIKADMAVIDEERVQGTIDERCCIMTCCTKLIKHDCHVIILSDDVEFSKMTVDKMRVFTIDGMKGLLSKIQHEKEESFEPVPNNRSDFKIVISNTEAFKINENCQTVMNDNMRIQANPERIESENQNTDLQKCRTTPEIYEDLSHKEPEKRNLQRNKGRTDSCMSEDSDYDLDIDFPVDIYDTDSDILEIDSEISAEYFETECRKDEYLNTRSISENISKDNTEIGCNQVSNGNDNQVSSGNDSQVSRGNDSQVSRGNDSQVSSGSEISKEREFEIVMFEVTNNAMEEYLRKKQDECVSRFVKIIEKVFNQLLWQEPAFMEDMPPPRYNICEAIRGIKSRFYYDTDVGTAATKLLNSINELGGLRGYIKNDISPHKYMEMYSFGVYLIDTLQDILTDSEDLQIASKSLSILLKDIQNPCTQEGLVDFMGNSSFSTEETEQPPSTIEDNHKKNSATKHIDTKNTKRLTQYSLHYHSETKLQEEENNSFCQNSVDSDSSYLSGLELRRNLPSTSKSNNHIQSNDHIYVNGDCDSFTNVHGNNDKVEPKIIRKFVICMEMEEKLKKKLELFSNSCTKNHKNYKEELSELPSNFCTHNNENDEEELLELPSNSYTHNNENDEEELLELPSNSYTHNNENDEEELLELPSNSCTHNNENDEEELLELPSNSCTHNNENDEEELSELPSNSSTPKNKKYGIDYEELDYEELNYEELDYEELDYEYTDDSYISQTDENNSDNNFELYLQELENYVKTTLMKVHTFCKNSYQKLSSTHSDSEKCNIIVLADKTFVFIDELCKAFTGIMERDKNGPEFKEPFKITGFNDVVVPESRIEKYKTVVGKLLKYGNVLKETLRLLAASSKEDT